MNTVSNCFCTLLFQFFLLSFLFLQLIFMVTFFSFLFHFQYILPICNLHLILCLVLWLLYYIYIFSLKQLHYIHILFLKESLNFLLALCLFPFILFSHFYLIILQSLNMASFQYYTIFLFVFFQHNLNVDISLLLFSVIIVLTHKLQILSMFSWQLHCIICNLMCLFLFYGVSLNFTIYTNFSVFYKNVC